MGMRMLVSTGMSTIRTTAGAPMPRVSAGRAQLGPGCCCSMPLGAFPLFRGSTTSSVCDSRAGVRVCVRCPTFAPRRRRC
ncbi:hypothetical protein B0H13DRAFT_2019896 [Mycena leptocephala]|nr:hypothetical protein B0H13DRAFT_2019896 [Mycena leptocephala]